MRLRPEGRVGAIGALARRLPGLPPRAGRAVGAPGAAQGARVGGRRARRRAVHGAGPRGRLSPRRRRARGARRSAAMKREIDRELARARGRRRRPATSSSAAAASARSSSSCRPCSCSTAATMRGCASANTLKALFRLTERGYLAPELGRTLSHALVHLRTVEHRLQLLHELQTHTLPKRAGGAGRSWRGASASAARRRAAARAFRARHRAVTDAVHRAFRRSSPSGRSRAVTGRGCRACVALGATGFADPERARQNLRLILEGRPLVPYAGALRARPWSACTHAARRALEEPRSGRGAEPVRALPVGGGAARRATSSCWPTMRCCSRDWYGSAPAAICSPQLLIAQPELLASLADPSRAGRPRTSGHGAGRRWPGCGRRGGAGGAARPAARRSSRPRS